MLTVAWVNYSNSDKRGPNKRFVEYLVSLQRIVDKDKIKFVAIFPFATEDSKMIETFKENNVEYFITPFSSYLRLLSPNPQIRIPAVQAFGEHVEKLKTLFQQIQCDIVISNCTLVWEAVFAAKALKIKHVLFIRGLLNPSDFMPGQLSFPLVRYMERKLVELSDLVVTQSAFTAKLWGLEYFISKEKAIIPIASDLKGNWEVPDFKREPLKVLLLSGIESYKNQLLVIDTAYQLKQRGHQVIFNIYGNHQDIGYRQLMEQEIARYHLQDVINIQAYDSDIEKIFLEHQLLLVTSKLETFGATVVEAMARYRPVISTRCGGPEEIIVDGKTGVLVEANQKDALTQAFIEILQNPEKLYSMGLEGHKRWQEKYKIESVMQEWIRVLEKLSEHKSDDNLSLDEGKLVDEIKLHLLGVEALSNNNNIKKWLVVAKNTEVPSIKIGVINALEELKNKGVMTYEVADYQRAWKFLDWADCILFSRVIEDTLKTLLNEVIRKGKTTMYYVDDSLYNIPQYASASRVYNTPQAQSTISYFIQHSTEVVTCSEWLAQSYKEKYNRDIKWILPSVQIISSRKIVPHKDKLLIGFAGNIDYVTVLEQLKDMFIKLYDHYKDKIQFEFFGPKVSFLEAIEAIYYAPIEYKYYEMFLARRQWDIGLAYLEDSDFNNNKYFNKYLEYSRFKIAGVYSEIPLYQKVIQDEYTGLLAKNTIESWYTQIEKLIHYPTLRKSIAQNAYNDVCMRFSVEQGAQSIQDNLTQYI